MGECQRDRSGQDERGRLGGTREGTGVTETLTLSLIVTLTVTVSLTVTLTVTLTVFSLTPALVLTYRVLARGRVKVKG